VSGIALIAFASGAQAQTDASATAPAEEPVANNEADSGDIVVMARRRAELSQDVPLAITAFSQESLRANNVTSAVDLSRVAPGLVGVPSSGNPNLVDFSIRGRGLVYGSAAGSVETYFGEVPLSPNFQMPQLPPQFFDLQSVQVLKGPQGTLFGRSTTGGAVLLQPQLPTDRFEGYARLQGGNYSNVQAEGAINLPISDTLSARVSGFYWHRDGYVRAESTLSPAAQATLSNPANVVAIFGVNPFNFQPNATYDGQNVVTQDGQVLVRNNVIIEGASGEPFRSIDINNRNVLELRGILKFEPSSTFTNTTLLTYHYDRNLGGTTQGSYLLRNQLGVPTGTLRGLDPDPYKAFISTDPRRPGSKSFAVINTTSAGLTDNLTAKNIFGYIRSTGYNLDGNDTDAGLARTIDNYEAPRRRLVQQITDEVQLQGTALDDRLDFTVGGLVDLIREPQSYAKLNATSANTAFGAPDPAHPDASPVLVRYLSTNVSSYALYGAFTYKLSDALAVSAGYRHSWNDVDGTQATTFYPSLSADPIPQDADPDVAGLQLTRKLQNKAELNTYNLTVDYSISDDVRVYASYRHGEKRGAFNGSAFGSYPASFGPEKVDSFSAGFKSQMPTGLGRLTFNIEGFYDKYKDYQAGYLLFDFPTGSIIALTANIPKVRYYGVDTSVKLAVTGGIDIDVGYSYLNSKILSLPDPTVTPTNGLVDPGLTVNKIPGAPKHSLQAAVRFFGESDLGQWAIRPSVSYRSVYYYTLFNRVLPAGQAAVFGQLNSAAFGANTVPAQTLVDLRFELNEVGGSRLSLAAGATNLLDKAHISGATGTLPFGSEGYSYSAPRMVYGEVSIKF
jgi:iron complex outermembrane receptor protein